jgi:hypothetical protein
MLRLIQSAALTLALALGACAAASPIVQTRVPGPLPVDTFRISAPPAEAGPSADGVERLVAKELQARGLMEAGDAADPAYLVEIAFGRRPRGVAAAVPGDQGAEVVLPAVHRTLRRPLVSGAETLAVRIVERTSGRELYAANATVASRTPVAPESLVRSALQPLDVTR